MWKRESERNEQIENELKNERERIYKEYGRQIKEQIDSKKEATINRMDAVERALNKDLLKEVVENVTEIPPVKLIKKGD